MEIIPKRLIVDLLSTAPKRSMPVAALIVAGELFGISENHLRVSLARLRAVGTVETDDRGRYRLAERTASVGRQVSSWREIDQRLRAWTGNWIGVHTAGVSRSERRSHRHSDRALRFLGFEPFDAGLHLRPDNLKGGIESVRRQLHDLGLDKKAMVFVVADLDDEAEGRARRLWDTEDLHHAYRASRLELQTSQQRLSRLPLPEALVESFVLGGRVLRQIVLDPLLPEPLVQAAERSALVEAMAAYDRAGRACWASFLQQAISNSARHRRPSVRSLRGEAA
ncbi:MAG TPA: hypothetical protein VMT89_17640 [Candidatus Acidoferrales bacterium]|nr:hypothetical protein [Candidatus Acidoferrales bacterium]